MVTSFYSGATAGEKAILTDLRDHEGIHRDFFKGALGTNALPARVPDFSGIDFTQRTIATGEGKLGVLDATKAFEDLGVAAYNGAGCFITSPNYLTLGTPAPRYPQLQQQNRLPDGGQAVRRHRRAGLQRPRG